MKLLLDQGLPRSAAGLLNAADFDTIHVGDIGYATADDEAILAKAREEARVVVTLDADFHTLMALSGANGPSVIRVRLQGLRAPALVDLLLYTIEQCRNDLDTGALVTVQRGRIRVHHLPLLPATSEESATE